MQPSVSDPTAFVVKVISQLLSDLVARNDQARAKPCVLNSAQAVATFDFAIGAAAPAAC